MSGGFPTDLDTSLNPPPPHNPRCGVNGRLEWVIFAALQMVRRIGARSSRLEPRPSVWWKSARRSSGVVIPRIPVIFGREARLLLIGGRVFLKFGILHRTVPRGHYANLLSMRTPMLTENR